MSQSALVYKYSIFRYEGREERRTHVACIYESKAAAFDALRAEGIPPSRERTVRNRVKTLLTAANWKYDQFLVCQWYSYRLLEFSLFHSH